MLNIKFSIATRSPVCEIKAILGGIPTKGEVYSVRKVLHHFDETRSESDDSSWGAEKK